jgi:murein L,D-transpeptidase YafK
MLHALLVSVLSVNMIVAAPVLSDSTARATPLAAANVKLKGPMGLVDSIVVEKRMHQLTLFRDGKVIRSYLIALGAQPKGAKVRIGDNRTPEGVYYIDARQPFSKYHLALHISYPSLSDKARAQALGTEPGGDIMIHGLPNGMGSAGARHRMNDWTNGCIALTDEEIEEIWSVVPIGTPIEIKP